MLQEERRAKEGQATASSSAAAGGASVERRPDGGGGSGSNSVLLSYFDSLAGYLRRRLEESSLVSPGAGSSDAAKAESGPDSAGSGGVPSRPGTATAVAAAAAVVAAILSGGRGMSVAVWTAKLVFRCVLQCAGVAVGVGLGLGLATHVYDILAEQRLQQEEGGGTGTGGGGGVAAVFDGAARSMHFPPPSNLASSAGGTGGESAHYAVRQRAQSQSSLPSSSSTKAVTAAGDEQTYAGLMKSAGYSVHPLKVLRGQVLRNDQHDFFRPNYDLSPKNILVDSKALELLRAYFPLLPNVVHVPLARLIELITRDYVHTWYSMVDSGCYYEEVKRGDGEGGESSPASGGAGDGDGEDKKSGGKDGSEEGSNNNNTSDREGRQRGSAYARRMVYSTARHVPLPFLERAYDSMAIAFGNLATRVEHVNAMELVLLKWTRILAHQFKVYRVLRKAVMQRAHSHHYNAQQQQQQQQNVNGGTSTKGGGSSGGSAPAAATAPTHASTATDGFSRTSANPAPPPGFNLEIQMCKEFLFAGKLHRAVTFGLDVPSLLFADGSGKECGRPSVSSRPGNEDRTIDDDSLLEERLFETPLLEECELDYHRVLGHRIIRALLPRHDVQAPLLSTLLTEIMAGCVLTPVLSCFCPEYMNSWIISGLEVKKEEEDGSASSCDDNVDEPSGGLNEQQGETGSMALQPGDSTDPSSLQQQGAAADQLPSSLQSLGTVPEEEAASSLANRIDMSQQQQKQPTSMSTLSTNTTPPHSPVPTSGRTILATADLSPASSPSPISPTRANKTGADIITLLALALIELRQYVDFDEFRNQQLEPQPSQGEVNNVDWDNPGCRYAILRLILVIEAALTHGRCTYRIPRGNNKKEKDKVDEEGADNDNDQEDELEDVTEIEDNDGEEDMDGTENSVEVTLPDYESATLSQILMEMTSDIEAFEERVAAQNAMVAEGGDASGSMDAMYADSFAQKYKPTPTEQSTLRTLIAAWLHTGEIYRIVTVLVQAHASVLAPYYHSKAFLRDEGNASGFVRQLKALDKVEVLVDTMAVLASPRLDEVSGDELNAFAQIPSNTNSSNLRSPSDVPGSAPPTQEVGSPTSSFTSSHQYSLNASASNPRYLDFRRNEAFASSLRSERERRMQSWEEISLAEAEEEGLPIIHRSTGITKKDIAVHKELHHIARLFYSGTNLVALRDAARKKTFDAVGSVSEASEMHVTLLTVETASQRRKIEIPDDDSSFLLRAHPRALNAVGVHRDQRNHENSFKCYAATYEEPALNTRTEHYSGGKYIRRCLVRYYPIDRTASVSLQTSDARKLDQRRGKSAVPDTITVGQPTSRGTPFLSSEFLRERHLCQRWVPKGTSRTQSLLTNSVMEPTDFTSVPRSGKAIDFVYRMAFFERPMIDLNGKHFTVQDQASLGTHRADASSLEISDATLSAALLMAGAGEAEKRDDASVATKNSFELGPDGYPIIWMKMKSQKEEDTQVEVKPYRLSFVRAALMVTAARQEAQLQSLISCVRSGSAKNATKALTESRLKPTARLLEYAGNRSREKESILLRDLKLGGNHIAIDQLRRNGLLNPRYPTAIRELSVAVEDAVSAPDVQGIELFGASGTLYKIRCVAVADIEADDLELEGDLCYSAGDGAVFRSIREEWVVYRSFKDFQLLHKHLKTQVSASESSGSAGSRLVGAATAAFAAGSGMQGRSRQRAPLIPSLSQASKVGALGATRRSILKRKEALDAYLKTLLSPGHFLSRSSEVLLFTGALYPFPPEVLPGPVFSDIADALGRTEMSRTVVATRLEPVLVSGDAEPALNASTITERSAIVGRDDELPEESEKTELLRRSSADILISAIQNKVTKVPLSLVRNRIFEAIRYLFGFENASFIRNRMLVALKTVSFAVTTNSEFQKTLYKIHKEQLSAEAVAGWIDFGVELMWPGGVFYESSPPTSPQELEALKKKARKVLHESFPEAFRAVLGQDLTRDGVDIFHEMLQNRIVVKSLAYMLFDLLWLDLFPELGDLLTGGAVLDIDT